jgi:Derlin-2/3
LLTIHQLTGGLLIGGVVLLSPLSMALMYTFALENPNAQISFFIVQMPAKFLPYASLVITFLLAGPHQTMVQATGILSAHAYEFLDVIWPEYGGGPRLIQVPQFVQKLFAVPAGTGQTRSHGTAFGARPGGIGSAPGAQAEAGRGGGWTSGSAWNSRGAGRRLGGE